MNKYNEAYELSGNAVHILATSLAGIKGRVIEALREIRYIRPDQLPERELVTYSYNKLSSYMAGDLYDHFFRKRATKLQEIANIIYELHLQISQDYHFTDRN